MFDPYDFDETATADAYADALAILGYDPRPVYTPDPWN